jgi:hypothetical protein
MIIDQADRDNAVHALLEKLSEVYTFMNEDGRLAEIKSMQAIYRKIARQTLECAGFITDYSKTKSACESNSPRRPSPDTQCSTFAQGRGLPRTSCQRLMP